MKDPDHLLAIGEKASIGHFGPLKSMDDVHSDAIIIKYIKEAMALIEKGAKPKKEIVAEGY